MRPVSVFVNTITSSYCGVQEESAKTHNTVYLPYTLSFSFFKLLIKKQGQVPRTFNSRTNLWRSAIF